MSERLGHNPNQISLKEKDYVVTLMQREQKAWGLKDIPPPPDALFEVLHPTDEKDYVNLNLKLLNLMFFMSEHLEKHMRTLEYLERS